MEFRQTIGSAALDGVLNLPPMLRNRQVEVIVLPAVNKAEEMKPKRQIGCCPDIPELPDSFFDPLPEEDLQAWGL
jgi:hypothetical protein